jgi:hypothetical protein
MARRAGDDQDEGGWTPPGGGYGSGRAIALHQDRPQDPLALCADLGIWGGVGETIP